MIRNDRQYKISLARIEEFEALLASQKGITHDQWSDLEIAAIRSQLSDLREEIDDYEKLKAGGVTHFEIDSLEALPTVLVKARIASGLTQKQLAEKLGLKEQQIQRYEQNDYAGVSIDRIRQIIEALNICVKQNIFLQTNRH